MNEVESKDRADLNVTGDRVSWQCSCLAHNVVHFVRDGMIATCGLCGSRVEIKA